MESNNHTLMEENISTVVGKNGSSYGIVDLPGEILVHGIIPFISEYHPKDVMRLILLNHETKDKIMEGLNSFRIVGSEVYKANIARTNFKKPGVGRKRDQQRGFKLNFSKPKKLATQKDLIMLDKLKNLKSVTFESLFFNDKNKEKIISALNKVTNLSELKFVKCKGSFLEILKPFNEKLTSLHFIDCIGSIFHLHETSFPNCVNLVFSTKYFDGQHKKYKSKLITDLPIITPNLTSLTFIDKSSKSFSPATPSFYSFIKLKQLKELNIDTATFTCPKLSEILNHNPSLKCKLPSRFQDLLGKAKITITELEYFK